MDFNVSSAELLKGLMDVIKAIPSKPGGYPILENFLFVLKDDSLSVTASDRELTLCTTIPVSSMADEGEIAVPAKHFTDILKELPDQPVRIKTTSEISFELIWNSGSSTLPYFPAEDYPQIEMAGNDAIEVKFPSHTLLEGINKTIYATADDEMRPAMNGIYFDIEPGQVTFVASDSHKLICYTSAEVETELKASFILHKKHASVLKSILDSGDESVSVNFDAKTAVFHSASTIMVSHLITAKYPKYRDVIPQNNSNILKIDRQLMLNTTRRVAVCSSKSTNFIKLHMSEGQIEITAQDLGFSLSAYEKVLCDYNGEDLSIGFKSPFLIEILANINCDTIVMKFSDSRRAAIIVPSEEESDNEKVCCILMPIMVS